MSVLRSKANPRVRRWGRLQRDAALRRSERRALIEGVHLVEALLASGARPKALVASESGLQRAEIGALVRRSGADPVVLSDAVFRALSDTEAPQGIAAEIEIAAAPARLGGDCAFLDGIQDAGNVGAILRSAAALGVGSVVLGPGCADAWAPKVLRAAMGAHFGLRLGEARSLETILRSFPGTLVCTVPAGGGPLDELDLSGPIGWLLGGEGQGVRPQIAALARLRATIPMPGGAESLNVAAAAAICFYSASRQKASRPAARS